MKQVIDWFEIPVSDLSRAQVFYETVLGTQLMTEAYGGPGVQMAVFPAEGEATKGALVAGYPALQAGGSGVLVYLHAGDSLDAALARVLNAGGQVVMGKMNLPDGLGCFAHMQDLDGNRVGLHAYA